MKKILSVILCIATLCSMIALCASAEDAFRTVEITNDPTVAVKRADGEIVYELELRFGTGAEDSSLPFTSFDAEKTILIGIETGIFNRLTQITAKPTAYDPQTGVLTAAVYNHKGKSGMNLHQLEWNVDSSQIQIDELPAGFDLKLVDADSAKYLNAACSYTYTVQIPENLLRGDGIGNAEYVFTMKKIDGQAVRNETITLPKSMNVSFKILVRALKKEWFQKAFHRLMTGSVSKALMGTIALTIIVFPSYIPVAIRALRAVQSSLVALSGIKFGGLISAMIALEV